MKALRAALAKGTQLDQDSATCLSKHVSGQVGPTTQVKLTFESPKGSPESTPNENSKMCDQ